MTKTRQSNLAITATDLLKIIMIESIGISGCDSKIWLPRFCHINSLEDKISNTAATIQPNPFWFWEKSIYISIYLSVTKAIAGLQIRALLKLLGCLYNNWFDCMHFENIVILFVIIFYTIDLECWPNFCSSPKLKNFIFGGTKGAFRGFSRGFVKLKPSQLGSLWNSA